MKTVKQEAVKVLTATGQQPTRLLRVKQVSELTSKGVSTIWRDVKNGTFPAPFKLSVRVTVWDSNEVDEWIDNQLHSA